MLCRRMHLAERHMQPPKAPSSGPIVRPCSHKKETPPSPVSTARTKCQEPPNKIPLMIVDINMSPETKTMVQKDVKKDPRKTPPFCKLYQSGSKVTFVHEHIPKQSIVPQLLIKGVELPMKNDETIKSNTHENEIDQDLEELFNEYQMMQSLSASSRNSNDSCSSRESISDNASLLGYHTNCVNAPLTVKEYMFNLEQYGMDKNGCLPGLTRAVSPHLEILSPSQAPPSPNTRQIIRVDVTLSKEKSEPEKSRPVSRGTLGDTRRYLKENKKKTKLKFKSSFM